MQDLSSELEKLVEKKALVIAQSKLMRDKLKSHLAVIQQDFINQGLPVTKAEVAARASDKFRQKLDEATKIVQEAEIAQAKRKGLEMRHEYYRSMNSLEKQKLKELHLNP